MGPESSAFFTKQQDTLCPFARTAKVTFGPAYETRLSEAANCDAAATALGRWAASAEAGRSHGFVLEVGASPATDFEEVRDRFRTTLLELNSRDPTRSDCMQRRIAEPGWQFEFAGLRLFLNVFGACYSPNHSKYVAVEDRFFVFAQPEYSFDLCGINRGRTATKIAIRNKFAAAGQPYSGDLIDARIEAQLYMFPASVDAPAVEWWKA